MISKLILGTVQLGLNYGINNKKGKPTMDQAFNILNTAYNNGIRILDTAEAYGDSQEVIGEFHRSNPSKKFKIITKLDANKNVHDESLISIIKSNCTLLSIDSLYGYMFHNYSSFVDNKAFYEELLEAKEMKLIEKAGISLYSNEEVLDIVDNYKGFDFIQIPFNLLDNESKRKSIIEKAKKEGIAIHVRSTFLQGLFFKDTSNLQGKLLRLKPYLEQLEDIKTEFNVNTETLALQYTLQKTYIDKVLIGVESVDQLKNNISICSEKRSIPSEIIDKINVVENDLLNPSNWI